MRIYPIIFIFVVFSGACISSASAADGVLVSSGTVQKYQQQENQIRDMVQESVFSAFESRIRDVLTSVVNRNSIPISQDLAPYALQQVMLQMTKNQSILEIMREIYKDCFTLAQNLKKQNAPDSRINELIGQKAREFIGRIIAEPVFPVVLENVLKQTMMQQQQIAAQSAAQRQAKINAMMQQRYQMIQQEMANQYQQALERFIAEREKD